VPKELVGAVDKMDFQSCLLLYLGPVEAASGGPELLLSPTEVGDLTRKIIELFAGVNR
jgi:hypothetical protein